MTNKFNVTRAYENVLPVTAPIGAENRLHVYQYSGPTATTGYGPYGASSYTYHPAFAYTSN